MDLQDVDWEAIRQNKYPGQSHASDPAGKMTSADEKAAEKVGDAAHEWVAAASPGEVAAGVLAGSLADGSYQCYVWNFPSTSCRPTAGNPGYSPIEHSP